VVQQRAGSSVCGRLGAPLPLPLAPSSGVQVIIFELTLVCACQPAASSAGPILSERGPLRAARECLRRAQSRDRNQIGAGRELPAHSQLHRASCVEEPHGPSCTGKL